MNNIEIISHPKCGRSWIWLMLLSYVNEVFNSPPSVTRAHKGSSGQNRKKQYNNLIYTPHKYKINSPAIFLVRDPRDIMVSFYFWIHNRKKAYTKDLSSFIRSIYGIKYVSEFYKDWDTIIKNNPNKLHLVRYEDLYKNTPKEIEKILRFYSFPIKDRYIKKIVQQHNFNSLVNRELKNQGNLPKEQRKFREGKIGQYKQHFNRNDISFMEKIMEAFPCDITKHYLEDY